MNGQTLKWNRLRWCSGLVVATVLCAQSVGAQIPKTNQAGGPLDCKLHGRPLTGWGFSAEIPKGFSGCLPGPHGIIIPMSVVDENRFVGIAGRYNASFETDVSVLVDKALKSLVGEQRQSHVRMISRRHVRLCGAPAELYVTKSSEPGTEAEVVTAVITALSSAADEFGIPRFVHEMTLTSTSKAYEKDRRTFDQIVQSCRVEKPEW